MSPEDLKDNGWKEGERGRGRGKMIEREEQERSERGGERSEREGEKSERGLCSRSMGVEL